MADNYQGRHQCPECRAEIELWLGLSTDWDKPVSCPICKSQMIKER